jgi:hypothetical protein
MCGCVVGRCCSSRQIHLGFTHTPATDRIACAAQPNIPSLLFPTNNQTHHHTNPATLPT